MSFKDYLEEEYYNTYKLQGKTIEIFLNPSSSEPKNNPKEVRAILDKKGDLFAWDGETDIIHEPMIRRLNKENSNTIPLFIYPRKKVVDISFIDYDPSILTQQEVDRIKQIVKNNDKLIRYMNNKFKITVSHTLFE